MTTEARALEDRGSKIEDSAPAPALSSILYPPSSASERQITLADSDLTLQKWCIENLHALELDPDDQPLSPEDMAGVLSLLRMFFEYARAADDASGRLWCELTPPLIAIKLGRARSTVMEYLRAGRSRRLILDSPSPRRANRLRYRPAWDVIAPRLHAAAITGRIPGAPLFATAVATATQPEGCTPTNCPVTGHISNDGDQYLSDCRTGFETSDASFSSFSSIQGRGVRGETPLKGFPPFTPPATCPITGHISNDGEQNLSGYRTGSVGRQARRQLLIDFAVRATRLEETATRSEHKLDEIKDGQGIALGVLHEIRSLVGGNGPAKVANARPRRAASQKARAAPIGDVGYRLWQRFSSLPSNERGAIVARCAAAIGPHATEHFISSALQRESERMIEIVYPVLKAAIVNKNDERIEPRIHTDAHR